LYKSVAVAGWMVGATAIEKLLLKGNDNQ